jgi:outer membrane autotransporter protein
MKLVACGLFAWLLCWTAVAAVGAPAPKAAAGYAFSISPLSGSTVSGVVTVIGTEDTGGGLDSVLVRCELYNGATGFDTFVGTPVTANVPVGEARDVPISCSLTSAQLQTFQSTAGSYLYIAVEKSNGKVVARSPAIVGTAVSAGPLRFVNPRLVITSVTAAGQGRFNVSGHYSVTVQGTGTLPQTAQLGWYTTGNPVSGGGTPLQALTLTASPSGTNTRQLDADFANVALNTAGVAGLRGSAVLFVSVASAPAVVANISFPTTLTACTATASSSNVLINQAVTLTVTCPGSIGALAVEWRDADGTVVARNSPTQFTPTQARRYNLTAYVTDQLGGTAAPQANGASISANGINATSNSVIVDASSPGIGISSGNNQIGVPGTPLPQQLQVLVSFNGQPAPAGVQVAWTLDTGTGAFAPPTSATNPQGIASTTFTPTGSGPWRVRASAVGNAVAFFDVRTRDVVDAPVQETAQVQQQVALNAPRAQIANIQTRLDQLRLLRNASAAQGLRVSYNGNVLPLQMLAAAAEPTKTDAASSSGGDVFERNGFYVQGDVEIGRQGSVDRASGFHLRTRGVTVGLDHRFEGNHVLGAAVGYMRSDTDIRDDGGSQDANGWSFSGYGSYVVADNGYVNVIANAGRNRYHGTRNADGESFGSSTSGRQYGVAVSGGYDFNRENLTFGPYGRIEYVRAKIDAFSEDGGTGALSMGEQTVTGTFLAVGGQANWTISASWGVFQPNLRVEWQHQAAGNARSVSAQLIGDPQVFDVAIPGQDKNYGNAAVGLQFILPKAVQAYFNFEAPFGRSNYHGERYTLGVRIGF